MTPLGGVAAPLGAAAPPAVPPGFPFPFAASLLPASIADNFASKSAPMRLCSSASLLSMSARLAATALGLQNAIVRKLAVPDLTTTVLTMTLTGIAADTSQAGRGATILRRVLAVTAMFAGAIIGALIVLHDGRAAGLSLAVGLVAAVSISAVIVARKPHAWHTTGTGRPPTQTKH